MELLMGAQTPVFPLSPEEAADYQEIWDAILSHRRTADFLERGLYAAFKDKYGIDLNTESWELDRQQGVLLRKPT